MPAITITTVDPVDREALRAWWQVAEEVGRERLADLTDSWPVTRRGYHVASPESSVTLLRADDGNRPVGLAEVVLPLADNTHLAYGSLKVVPAARRRGIGSRLLAEMEQIARDAGRRTVAVDAWAPPGEEGAGERFGRARGYLAANREQIKVLELSSAQRRWTPLDERVAARIGDHRIVT